MDIELAQALAENELLKSLLYCTKRSCNNCGKVTCENFQRQRIDCCGNWVSYKDYIKQLEKETETLSQNLDDAMSVENCLKKRITDLEAQIEKMKCCENCAKRGHICVAEEMQGNLCGKNKDKWELRR